VTGSGGRPRQRGEGQPPPAWPPPTPATGEEGTAAAAEYATLPAYHAGNSAVQAAATTASDNAPVFPLAVTIVTARSIAKVNQDTFRGKPSQ
jgi:hypothetical protein